MTLFVSLPIKISTGSHNYENLFYIYNYEKNFNNNNQNFLIIKNFPIVY